MPHLVVTRLHDRSARRIPLHEGQVLNVTRSFVQRGRDEMPDDKYASRGVHVQIYVLRGRLWLYNAHVNYVSLYPKGQVVRQGGRARVGGRSFCFGPMRRPPSGNAPVSVTQLHVELEEDTDTPPSTPTKPR
jgi:hypothetical protein